MNAHVLTIGAEILTGDIVDTNFRDIARLLHEAGVFLTAHHTVTDDVEAISDAVKRALAGADLVVVTGGLGPTPDDCTREGVAHAFGVSRTLRRDLIPELEALYRRFGIRDMPQSNLVQLELPDGAEAVPNPEGTAPGFRIGRGGSTLFAVPGVPREMRRMVEDYILPWILEHHDLPRIHMRLLRTMGIGESHLHERLAPAMDTWRGVGVAFYPHSPGVDLKLTHHGKDDRRIERELDRAETEARELLGAHVFGVAGDDLEAVVGRRLVERSETLAIAESCTGGAIAAAVTSVPGSSRYLDRGLVTYSNRSKVELLGVPQSVLDEQGAVSEAAALAMAHGVRERSGTTWGLATTGIAGPGGGTEDKPVGLVFIALSGPGGDKAWLRRHPGPRGLIVRRTTAFALDALRRALETVDDRG